MTLAILPETITSIGISTFYHCTSLNCLVVKATTPPTLYYTVFVDTPIASGTGYIYVPDESVDAYKQATNWSQYASQIKPLSEYVEE